MDSRSNKQGVVRSWRMALRFLLRSLDLRASSFSLALLAVAVGASVATTGFNLRADLKKKMTHELRQYGANLLVTPPLERSPGAAPATLDQDWLPAWTALAPAGARAWVSPMLFLAGQAGEEAVLLMGMDFPAARELGTTWKVEGAWPDAGASMDCLVGSSLAGRIGLTPGDLLPVSTSGSQPETFRVAGIVSTGESEDDAVLVPLHWLQSRSGNERRVSVVAVALEAGPEAVRRYAAAIEANAPFPLEARVLVQVSRAQGALLGRLDRLMTLLTMVILLLAGMCVMSTLMSIVVERESEIGLMRSLGARDTEILRMLLGEATLLALCGGALGIAVGMWNAHWMGQRLFNASITPQPQVVLWVLGITLGLCWMAVLLPLQRALAVQPANALRG